MINIKDLYEKEKEQKQNIEKLEYELKITQELIAFVEEQNLDSIS